MHRAATTTWSSSTTPRRFWSTPSPGWSCRPCSRATPPSSWRPPPTAGGSTPPSPAPGSTSTRRCEMTATWLWTPPPCCRASWSTGRPIGPVSVRPSAPSSSGPPKVDVKFASAAKWWRCWSPTTMSRPALVLEDLWNDVAQIHTFTHLCAYPMRAFDRDVSAVAFGRICQQHSTVIPTEGYSLVADSTDRHRAIAKLQQQTAALQAEVVRLRAHRDTDGPHAPAGDQRDRAGDRRHHAGALRDRAGDRRDRAGDRRHHAGVLRDQAGDQRVSGGESTRPGWYPAGPSGRTAGPGGRPARPGGRPA